jgi:hypothetical protein
MYPKGTSYINLDKTIDAQVSSWAVRHKKNKNGKIYQWVSNDLQYVESLHAPYLAQQIFLEKCSEKCFLREN